MQERPCESVYCMKNEVLAYITALVRGPDESLEVFGDTITHLLVGGAMQYKSYMPGVTRATVLRFAYAYACGYE